MRISTVVTLVSVVVLALGCSEDPDRGDAPVQAARLPENLCEQLPAVVLGRWSLTEQNHRTTSSPDKGEALCTMTGSRAGAPVTLAVRATSFGDLEESSATDRLTEDLAAACEELGTDRRGTERTENRCTWVAPRTPRTQLGEAIDISRNLAAQAVIEIEMGHAGQNWSQVGAEVVNLALSLSADGLTR